MKKYLIGALLAASVSFSALAKDVNTDIVVVGGGGAGLTAAIAAQEAGANVILVEKMLMLGGNTNYATSWNKCCWNQITNGTRDSRQFRVLLSR